MTPTQLFWQMLHDFLAIQGTCRVVTESTHSTPLTESVTLFGGRCITALLYVLQIPGTALFIG
jgi:hypothetical protein